MLYRRIILEIYRTDVWDQSAVIVCMYNLLYKYKINYIYNLYPEIFLCVFVGNYVYVFLMKFIKRRVRDITLPKRNLKRTMRQNRLLVVTREIILTTKWRPLQGIALHSYVFSGDLPMRDRDRRRIIIRDDPRWRYDFIALTRPFVGLVAR